MDAIDNWERSLKDILTETETNISNFKQNMTPRFESTPFVHRNVITRTGEGTSPYYTPRSFNYNNRLLQYPGASNTNAERFDKSSSLMISLSKRVEQLEQVTSSLNSTVASLQYENKVQSEEIKKLKDELKHVSKRLHAKGVDISSEQKFKMWQREVRSELDTVRSLIKVKTKTDDYNSLNDITLVSLSKDISDSKRLLQEEADLLRRELDNLRTRFLKIENEVAVVIGESKDLGMRQIRLEKDVSSVNDHYRSQSRLFTKAEKENSMVQYKVDELRTQCIMITCPPPPPMSRSSVERKEINKIQHEFNKFSSTKSEGYDLERKSKPLKAKSSRQKESIVRDLLGKDSIKHHSKVKRLSFENLDNSFENSYDLSLISTELDDLSLNTSLELSDELDPLDHDTF